LLVTFSEDMDDTTAGDEVTNVDNYLLLSEGSVAGFQTTSCLQAKTASVDPGDVQVAVTSVTYDSSTFTATLNLGSALPDGIYRLYACGTATLRDLAGNALGGGVDFIRNFQVQLPVAGGGGGGTGGGGTSSGGGNSGGNAATGFAGQNPVTGFAPGRITDLSGLPVTSYHATSGVTLEVPVLKLKLPIVGVPMQNKTWDVNWLLNQAGWLEGTAFPGYAGNSVLTSHVTLSYGQAGPFANLHKLKAGDKLFVHAFGDLYIYEVKSVKKLNATDASILKHEDKSWLTLVTCADYSEKAGTYLKRMVVKAVLVQTQPDPWWAGGQ
jgi:LPXTG-site transpeptidase (sortase) family protein